MNLSRADISKKFYEWLQAWNDHDLKGVMNFVHDEILYNTWNGKVVKGKMILERAWQPWFQNHHDFFFSLEDFLIDDGQQKMIFSWELDWLSTEKRYLGTREKRRGVDILKLEEGKIIQKDTYSKTSVEINSRIIQMVAV